MQQIFLLQRMVKTNEWKIYKNFVKELIMTYLNTTESKDFLRGLKFSCMKFEESIERELDR